jgi:hypothetical protein
MNIEKAKKAMNETRLVFVTDIRHDLFNEVASIRKIESGWITIRCAASEKGDVSVRASQLDTERPTI